MPIVTPTSVRYGKTEQDPTRKRVVSLKARADIQAAKPTVSNKGLKWGGYQLTGYLNSLDYVANYELPAGYVVCGEYSYYSGGARDRQFKLRYRTLSI